MQLLQFTTIKLTLCLIGGILMGFYLQPSLTVSFSLTLILLVLLGLVFIYHHKVPPLLFGMLSCFLTISIGILSLGMNTPKNYAQHYSHTPLEKNQVATLKIREVLKSTNFSERYIAEVNYINHVRVSGKVVLNITGDNTKKPLKVDDEIASFSLLQPITPPLNPHQFDYKKYLSHLGVTHQLKLNKDSYVILPNPDKTIFGLAAKIRNHIIEKLKKEGFGIEELGVIQALLLGQRNEITAAVDTAYKNAGAYHILALSGLHIGILLGLLHFLFLPLELLPKGRTIKLLLIVFSLWGFAFLAGLSASILRAVTMFSFVAYALYLNRPTSNFNILALSLFFILLLLDPFLLFQVGFQLSYAAVFSIVWIYPLMQNIWTPKYWILKKGWELVSVSTAAQLGVFPISLYYFNQFPGLFLVSSLLILPFLAFILGFGIVVITLSLTNYLPSFIVATYDRIIHWMNLIVGKIAQQEHFLFKDISFDAMQLVLSYGIIISMILAFKRATYKSIMTCMLLILGYQGYILGLRHYTKQKESLVIGHATKNTVLLHQTGQKVTVYTNNLAASTRITHDYALAENTTSLVHKPLENSYLLRQHRLVILDSSIQKLPKSPVMASLLLTQSTKINLERLIDDIAPTRIIADGSNYHSYIERWRTTCRKKKIPFYYTGEKGAFVFPTH